MGSYRREGGPTIIRNVNISDNTFIYDNTSSADGVPKVGVLIAEDEEIEDWSICNNIARKEVPAGQSNYQSYFIGIFTARVSGVMDRIVIDGNYCTGFARGIVLYSAVSGKSLGTIRITNNTILNPNTTSSFPSGAYGILAYTTGGASTVKELIIDNNSFIDNRASPQMQYGIRLSGDWTVNNLWRDGNKYYGSTVADFDSTGAVITNTRSADGGGATGPQGAQGPSGPTGAQGSQGPSGPTSGASSITNFTPTWYNQEFGSPQTAVTIGNGNNVGYYSLNGNEVTVVATLLLGSTTSIATKSTSGYVYLALPFASAYAGLSYNGVWRIYDDSVAKFYSGSAFVDGGGSTVSLAVDNGLFVRNAAGSENPVNFAAGDALSVQLTYFKT
jgi:hypothetical protein